MERFEGRRFQSWIRKHFHRSPPLALRDLLHARDVFEERSMRSSQLRQVMPETTNTWRLRFSLGEVLFGMRAEDSIIEFYEGFGYHSVTCPHPQTISRSNGKFFKNNLEIFRRSSPR